MNFTSASSAETISRTPSRPDRAVHHANALHLQHQLVLGRASDTGPCSQSRPFGRANFLDVEVLEEGQKIVGATLDVGAGEAP